MEKQNNQEEEAIIKGLISKPKFLKGKNNARADKILLILVHGWTSDPQAMLPLAKELVGKGYDINLPVLAGHGTRPEDLENVSWQDWVDDISREVDKYRRQYKYIFIGGSSLGGNIALAVAARKKINGLILIATPVYFANHLLVKMVSALLIFLRRYVRKRRLAVAKNQIRGSYPYFPAVILKQVFRLIKHSIDFADKVRTPTLILQVENDFFVTKYSPVIIYKKLAANLKRIVWLKPKVICHTPAGEEVAKAAQAIDTFISEVLAGKN